MTRPLPPDIPQQADERTTLLAFLQFYRGALLDRSLELTEAQFRTTHPPTSLSLARLVAHMAWVEQIWFRKRLHGGGMPDHFAALDFDASADAEMDLGDTMPMDQVFAMFTDSVADADGRIAECSSLDQISAEPGRDGTHWNLRWIVVHMIEEYARHCGHADLIREAIDGDTVTDW